MFGKLGQAITAFRTVGGSRHVVDELESIMNLLGDMKRIFVKRLAYPNVGIDVQTGRVDLDCGLNDHHASPLY